MAENNELFNLRAEKRMKAMVNNPLMADIKFIVGPEKRTIYAIKSILAIKSEYLYTLLMGGFKESSQEEIVLPEVNPDTFLEVIRFIYTGELALTDANIVDVCALAEMYMLKKEIIPFVKDFITYRSMSELLGIYSNAKGRASCIDEIFTSLVSNQNVYWVEVHSKEYCILSKEMLNLLAESLKDSNLKDAIDKWEYIHVKEAIVAKGLQKCIDDDSDSYSSSSESN
jgi:hypothetical protein